MPMDCQKCNKLMECGCVSCARRREDKDIKTYSVDNAEMVSCGYCGHTMHWEEWTDLEMEQYKKSVKPDK